MRAEYVVGSHSCSKDYYPWMQFSGFPPLTSITRFQSGKSGWCAILWGYHYTVNSQLFPSAVIYLFECYCLFDYWFICRCGIRANHKISYQQFLDKFQMPVTKGNGQTIPIKPNHKYVKLNNVFYSLHRASNPPPLPPCCLLHRIKGPRQSQAILHCSCIMKCCDPL